MRKLAEKYADSFKHLVALYAVTTQVTRKDAAALAGVTPWNWHKTYKEPMLQEVRYEFAQVFLERHSYTLPEIQPAEALLEQYRHTVCIAGAIRAQIDGVERYARILRQRRKDGEDQYHPYHCCQQKSSYVHMNLDAPFYVVSSLDSWDIQTK